MEKNNTTPEEQTSVDASSMTMRKIRVLPKRDRSEAYRKKAAVRFLLTLDSSVLIWEANDTYMVALMHAKFFECYLREEGKDSEAKKAQKEAIEKIAQALEERQIRPDDYMPIIEKVDSSKWWSYRVSSFNDSEKTVTYTIFVNEDTFTEVTLTRSITDTTPPEKELLELSGLPPRLPYVSEDELHCCNTMRRYYQVYYGSRFVSLKSSPVTSFLTDTGRSQAEAAKDDGKMERGKALVSITTQKGVDLLTPDAKSIASNIPADKLWTQIMARAVEQKSNIITISLDDIMEEQGLSDRKTARQTVKNAGLLLLDVQLKYESLNLTSYIHPVTAIAFQEGRGKPFKIVVEIGQSYYALVDAIQPIELLDRRILKIGAKNANAYFISKLYFSNRRRNIGTEQANRMRVSTLLSSLNLPTYDSLSDKAQCGQRIITPFINALDTLEEMDIVSYHFEKPMKRGQVGTLSDEELDTMGNDYKFFSSLIVVFDQHKYDGADYTHLIQAKKEARKRERGRPRKKKTEA